MSHFDDKVFADKLAKLNATAQSIETLSQWCQFHQRNHARRVVHVWQQELSRAPPPRQLAMAYLANDILQNSRKKGNEYVHEFYKMLPSAFKQLMRHSDDKMRKAIMRLVDIWEERRVFSSSSARPLKELIHEAHTPRRASSGLGSIGVPARYEPVASLADALAACQSAVQRCHGIAEEVAELDDSFIDAGGRGDLEAASSLFARYSEALQQQLVQEEQTLSILQGLLAPHESAKRDAAEQLDNCQQQQQLLQERLSGMLDDRPQGAGSPEAPAVDEDDATMDFEPPGSEPPTSGPAATPGARAGAPGSISAVRGLPGDTHDMYSPTTAGQQAAQPASAPLDISSLLANVGGAFGFNGLQQPGVDGAAPAGTAATSAAGDLFANLTEEQRAVISNSLMSFEAAGGSALEGMPANLQGTPASGAGGDEYDPATFTF